MARMGPNCMGVLSVFDGMAIWGTGSQAEHPGEIGAALISQSGAFIYGATNCEQGFPLGYGISIGNQAVVDAADCINAVLDDDRVRAIGLYIEGIEDGNALGRACWRALQKGVPVVALKGGDTPAGEAAAIGHTGAMVVQSNLWRSFAERFGIAEVSTPKALIETLKLLTLGGVPQGNRLSVVTYSGGLNGLIAARTPELGLDLVQPLPDGLAALRGTMPATVPISNPLDLNMPFKSRTGISMENGDMIGDSIADLARGVADMVVFFLDVPRHDEKALDEEWLVSIESMAGVHDKLGVPCIVAGVLPEGLEVALRQRLRRLGIIPLQGFAETLEALSVAGQLGQIHTSRAGQSFPALCAASSQAPVGKMLDEAASKTLMEPHGLVMAPHKVATAQAAPEIAAGLGFPVAVKVLSNTIAHKAKIGGVRLNIASESDVALAVLGIQQALAGLSDHPKDQHFLIEKMIDAPIAEYIIGVKLDAALGLAMMVGRGGVAVEEHQKHRTVLLPLQERELDSALAEIGLPARQHGRESFIQAVRAVAGFAQANSDTLQSLDINPVIITASGAAMAADALVVIDS
ncbi:MAG: acetate--CoA ligase family protein [Rhodobacteraceae bacterium]|nr:acetate--CoA ligase family protein [Paracoccaceae bacterium]